MRAILTPAKMTRVSPDHPQPLDAFVIPRFAGVRTFARLPYRTDLTGIDVAALAGGLIAVPLAAGAVAVRSRASLSRTR